MQIWGSLQVLILQGLQRQKICRTDGAFAYTTRLTQRLRAGLTCGAPPALGPRIRIAALGEMADRPKGRPLQKKERVAYPYSRQEAVLQDREKSASPAKARASRRRTLQSTLERESCP